MTGTNEATTDTGNTTSGETTEETIEGQETQEGTTEEQATEETSEQTKETAPVDYKLDDMPEGISVTDEVKTSLFELAKKHGLQNEALNDFVKEHIKSVTANIATQDAAALKEWEKEQETTKNTLLKDWGDDFEKNQTDVNKVLDRFFKGSFDHMFGKVEEGKTRDLKTRNLMVVSFEKGLFELSKVLSPDTLEMGEAATKQNKGLNDMFSDLNKQYKT